MEDYHINFSSYIDKDCGAVEENGVFHALELKELEQGSDHADGDEVADHPGFGVEMVEEEEQACEDQSKDFADSARAKTLGFQGLELRGDEAERLLISWFEGTSSRK
jgi:hydrogenase maturation factor